LFGPLGLDVLRVLYSGIIVPITLVCVTAAARLMVCAICAAIRSLCPAMCRQDDRTRVMVIVTVFLLGRALNACQSTGTPAVARPLAQAFPNSLQRIQSSPRKKEQGVRSRYFVSFLLEYRSTLLQKASYTLVQCKLQEFKFNSQRRFFPSSTTQKIWQRRTASQRNREGRELSKVVEML